MTQPPIMQDLAVLEAMRQLAIARQVTPPDRDAVERARNTLLEARKARGY